MKNKKEIRRIRKSDAEYPMRLRQIPGAPKELYVIGCLPKEEQPSVAIVGARDCSEYGRKIAAWLGGSLARAGVQVVSGMARGIDGISQQAALEAGGASFGVLGCGVDICYPKQNRELYEQLCEKGGILSEYEPGSMPLARQFPPRNRIVSGLADALIVVEAREKSGTLITVDMALEQGKDVYVVPGRITDSLSAGCNRLLKTGAGVLLDVDEFMAEVWGQQSREEEKQKSPVCNSHVRTGNFEAWVPVLEALDYYPQSVEEIGKKLPESMSQKQLTMALIRLCMENRAVQVSPGFFVKK